MICTRCNSDGVLVTILGKDSYYCRTCRDDILPQPVAPAKIPSLGFVGNFSSVNYTVTMSSEEYDFWDATRQFRDTCIKQKGMRVQSRPNSSLKWELLIDGRLK